MYQIVLTGPESTGKSTLACTLATHFKTVWVKEHARTYIEKLNRPYKQDDLLLIAKEQKKLVEKSIPEAKKILFIDTYFLVLKIWSKFKYQSCSPWIEAQLQSAPVDLYILCGTDVPWEDDPQREHPKERETLYQIYRQELINRSLPFIEVSGKPDDRFQEVRSILEERFGIS